MEKTKKICMLVSGGDAPGMNACMEAIFNYATRLGWEVWIARKGYQGLLDENLVLATPDICRNISHITGCVFKTSRSKEFATDEGKIKAGEIIKKHGFDATIIIGGNGSLAGAERLKKLTKANVIGIPATVDNDCYFTDNSIGFSSAVENIVRYVDMVKPVMQTCDRSFLFEVMGKGCSELAINAGIASFANLVDRSEKRFSVEQIAKLFNEQKSLGNTTCMAIIEENREGADNLLKDVQDLTGPEIRFERGYYYQRGMAPTARDRFLAIHYGVMAVDCIKDGKFGVAVGRLGGELKTWKLEDANKAKPKFKPADYALIDKIANW